MIAKLFEVRDAATLIPVVAIKMQSLEPAESWLLRRGGFGWASDCVFVGKIATGGGEYDPFAWPGGSRTMSAAHQFIEKEFDNLSTGAVVDVEFILGLSPEPKTSERLEAV